MMRSAASPFSSRARKPPAVPKFRLALWPVSRSKTGAHSFTIGSTAPVLMTLISATLCSLVLRANDRRPPSAAEAGGQSPFFRVVEPRGEKRPLFHPPLEGEG